MCLEEVEDEGLLVSWTLSKQPSFTLTVSPYKQQRQVRTSDIDSTNMIGPPHAVSRGLSSVYKLKGCIWSTKETHIMQSGVTS